MIRRMKTFAPLIIKKIAKGSCIQKPWIFMCVALHVTVVLCIYYKSCYQSIVPCRDQNAVGELSNLTSHLFALKKKVEPLKRCTPTPFGDIEERSLGSNFSNSDCTTPVVVHGGMGRMGNNICEYLSLLLLQYMFGIKIAVGPKLFDSLSSKFQNLSVPLYKKTCQSKLVSRSYSDLYYTLLNHVNSNSTNSHPINSLNNVSVEISSYPCPGDLLMPYRSKFRKEMKVLDGYQVLAKAKIMKTLELNNYDITQVTLISVHVRRTDYKEYMRWRHDRSLLSPCYYHQAFHYYRQRFKNAVFIVASEDLPWCQKHLSDTDVLILVSDSYSTPLIDLTVLTLCDHHIVGLGTYGFLTGFLGPGLIVHPYVLKGAQSGMENSYLCSNSVDLIPIPDNML